MSMYARTEESPLLRMKRRSEVRRKVALTRKSNGTGLSVLFVTCHVGLKRTLLLATPPLPVLAKWLMTSERPYRVNRVGRAKGVSGTRYLATFVTNLTRTCVWLVGWLVG